MTQNGDAVISGKERLDAHTPLLRAAAVELVQDDKVGLDGCDLVLDRRHEQGIGNKCDVLPLIT